MPRQPAVTRDKLVHAAAQVIAARGAARLTLDDVAREARVSKGGLLHHFPTKDALLGGLIDELVAVFRARLEREEAREVPGPGRWTRAYVTATFEPEPVEDELTDALSGAIAAHPDLLGRVRGAFAFLDERARADGLPPARALAVRLACDGLWLGECAGLPPVEGAARAALRAELVALATP